MIVEGEKQFLKLCLILKKRLLLTFLVAYTWVFSNISLKRYWGLCFCKFCKTFLLFCTNVVNEVILNLILGKVFPQRYSYCTSYGQAGITMNRFQFMAKGHIISFTIKNITIINIGSDKSSIYIEISEDLGSRLCNFRRSPRVLLIFKETIFRCSSNINLKTSKHSGVFGMMIEQYWYF